MTASSCKLAESKFGQFQVKKVFYYCFIYISEVGSQIEDDTVENRTEFGTRKTGF